MFQAAGPCVSDWRGKPGGRVAQRSVRGLGTESTTPDGRGNAQKNCRKIERVNAFGNGQNWNLLRLNAPWEVFISASSTTKIQPNFEQTVFFRLIAVWFCGA